VRAQGADLAVGGNVVLTEDAVDAKLVLSGPARPDAPGGTRPELAITLKGSTDAPKRTLEVAALSNWLALRAVEQQNKRIDALESGREINPPPVREPEASPPPGIITPAPPPRAVRTQTAPQRPRAPAQPSGSSASQARPAQPLDLRPPASRGNSLLETWFGR